MRIAVALTLGAALSLPVAVLAAPAAPATAAKSMADPTIPQPGWKPPKNAEGQPDLSGYWSNATMTPLARNAKLTDKATLSPTEARSAEKTWAAAIAAADAPTDPNAGATLSKAKASDSKLLSIRPEFAAAGGDVGGYNAFWLDPGSHIMEVDGQFRTSLLTTPNGEPPARKNGTTPARFARPAGRRDNYDSYEYRSLGERCIIGFGRNAGPPMLPNGFYNNDYQILQTPKAVVIDVEMIHDTRIIRLNAPHRTDGVRPWMGDSVGHYEGNTLVVETTNIPQAQNFMGSWKNLKVTEWFTRVSPTRLNYRFQVEDPDTWAQPWGGEYDFAPLHGIIYEYACHEGNYALPSILAGARRQEKAAASAPAQAKPGA
ncbi:hypothetical protein [Phenylobacterium sp.]|jgi:hypothetical protein|uniref:hypothetical protein n=1 Tax=Phenylobacterium sp. TaxID=1871053 RepID=UPI002F42E782